MKSEKLIVMVVDDDDSDRLLIQMAFQQNNVVGCTRLLESGEEAIDYLAGKGEYCDRARFPYPSMVMTDLKMPKVDGFGLLQEIKEHSVWKTIPVVILSGSGDEDDVKRAYAMGASCYLEKRADFADLCRVLNLLHSFWSECSLVPICVTGKQFDTEHIGKLGERFGPVK